MTNYYLESLMVNQSKLVDFDTTNTYNVNKHISDKRF